MARDAGEARSRERAYGNSVQLGATLPQTEIGPDPAMLVRFASTAEQAGFDFITAYDHVLGADTTNRPDWRGPYTIHSQFHEILVLFGFLAAHTTLELSTNILVLPQRPAALVAKQAAEIDVLTRGRFRLGVGIGWNDVEYEALGCEFADRAARYEEQIDVMRRLWVDDVVTYAGRYHTISAAGLLPRPVQRPIPIWMAGGAAPVVLDRVGRMADGWLPALADVDALPGALERIRAAADTAGRDPAAIGWQGGLWIPADGNLDETRRRLDTYRELGATHATIITMDAGRTPEQHLDAVATTGAALRRDEGS
jgi:probable F420-dependent oxidoreductase